MWKANIKHSTCNSSRTTVQTPLAEQADLGELQRGRLVQDTVLRHGRQRQIVDQPIEQILGCSLGLLQVAGVDCELGGELDQLVLHVHPGQVRQQVVLGQDFDQEVLQVEG